MMARSTTRSNLRPDTLMQDRRRQFDEIFLQHTAGPYISSAPALAAADAPAVTIPEALANETAGGRRLFDIPRTAIGRAAGGDGSADDRAADQSAHDACGDAARCAS